VGCAERAAGIELGGGCGGEDHAGDAAAKLEGGAAYPARRRMHDHDVSWLQRAEGREVQPGGEERLGDGGRLLERERLRDRHRLCRRNARLFRVASACQQGHHPVALPVPTGWVLDFSGDLEADGLRLAGRRRVAAESLVQVGAVHAGGAHAHDQIALAWLGIGYFGELQDFGAAGLLHDDGAHARLLL